MEGHQQYGIYRHEALMALKMTQFVCFNHVMLTELAMIGSFALIDEPLFFIRTGDGCDDPDVYRKKHLPKEPDGIAPFLRMTDAYMGIADRVECQTDRQLLKMALFSSSLLRNRHCLNMFGESIESLFAKPGFSELQKILSDTVSFIEHDLQKEYAGKQLKSGQLANQSSNRPRPQIAGEGVTNKDLTAIQDGSEFEKRLHELVSTICPRKIIETGTYLGTGTTRIIASALKSSEISNARFYTIECDPNRHQQAVNNLSRAGLSEYVIPLCGLSVPRPTLPSEKQIFHDTIEHVGNNDIFVDHQEENRVTLYHRETNFPDIPDDMLGKCLSEFDGQPEMVLLDSAGHMGTIEFNYVLERLKGECYIVLDDIKHIKHHKSYLQIQSDPRFTIVASSDEKFGFCMAKFIPVQSQPADDIRKILWIRTDSIGDAILAMSMLRNIKGKYPHAEITVFCQDHIAELYEICPHIDNIITFKRSLAMNDEEYRQKILYELQTVQADICFNSIYSRDILSDYFALSSCARTTIALNGDNSNMPARERASLNEKYTLIVPSPGEYRPELQRHMDLLLGVGIKSAVLDLSLNLTESDLSFADRILSLHGLVPEKTIVLFSGAQYEVRLYDHYGEALSSLCKEKGFSVIALGTSKDFVINQGNLKATGVSSVNMSGKLSLRHSAAVISRCRLAVGAETGLAHIACAVNTPNVILLGGGHFGRFMPYSPLTSAVSLPLECFGCNWRCRYSQVHCVRRIRPEVLSEAILRTLDEVSESPRIFVQSASSWQAGIGEPNYSDLGRWSTLTSAKIIGVP
jgi:ADP-heptose:LPS heptosyltransferase